MPTDCSAERFEFAPVDGRAVVAAFDGGTITSDAGALLLGATDRAIGLVRRFAGLLCRPSRGRAGRAQLADPGRATGVRAGAGLRGPGRPRPSAPRPGAGRGHRQAQRPSRRLRAAGRQVDPQPARARAGRVRPRAITRSATTGPRSSGCSSTCSSTHIALPPERDRARPGCHGRSDARRPGGSLLSRLLWLLLLPAALRLLRRPSAGGQAAAVEHRRQRRRGRGDRTDRHADPCPLAASAHRPARRFGLRP